MYKKPQSYKALVRAINATPDTKGEGEMLVHVEATLYLAELLHLDDEPVAVGWALLDGTPMPDRRLASLSSEQRRMLANARQIIPLNSRFAWEQALARYARIPLIHRNYEIVTSRGFHEQIINACKRDPVPHAEHLDIYEQMLTVALEFQHRAPTFPQANSSVSFFINSDGHVQRGTVRFDALPISHLVDLLDWFSGTRERSAFSIPLADLHETAIWLDCREGELGNPEHWAEDLRRIRFRQVEGNVLIDVAALVLDGFFHMAGMVSSGKTTLAKLIIVHAIRHGWEVRFTFVVGDTNTAIQMAHQFNLWFCGDPAEDTPVAVPILGQSGRAVHLERFLASQAYRDSIEHNQPHWGERWLSPVCPLNALVQWESDGVSHIPTGKEPCERLADSASKAGQTKHHLCPLFAICPSKQMYRDLPAAKLWITTPGALSQAALPRHLDNRSLKMSDVIYEQSDVVIIDEIETVVDWFDRTYADNLTLTDGGHGLIDHLDAQVTRYLIENRTPPPEYQEWVFAERAASRAITAILTVLNTREGQGLERVRGWLNKGYFTRNRLSYRLARRLAGLKEYELRTDLPAERQRAEEEQTKAVLSIFEALDDLLTIFQPQARGDRQIPGPTVALTAILQQMNNANINATTDELIEACKAWILTHFPDIEANIATLTETLQRSDHPKDKDYLERELLDRDVHDLAQKLFFTLWAVILDWHLNTLLNDWHHKPLEIASQQPQRKIPLAMRDILPVPALGAQYGLFRAPTGRPEAQTNPNHLTQFIYTNIGRSYILNFHRLRTDLDGRRGPNVLAMSGTSYLPDSSRFNVQHPPNGVLEPDEKARHALQNSRFEFRPFYDAEGTPIVVSGSRNKEDAIRTMIDAMLRVDRRAGGFFGQVLEQLRRNEASDPENWQDRARLLVFTNSYTQARIAARTLQTAWPERAKQIFYLNRGKDNQDYELESTLQRVDIEQFASKEGLILFAPLQSIGRGFNILNQHHRAAFGAVVFLTRPMWPPDDLPAMAQEVNRYTLQWAAQRDLPDALASADSLYGYAMALRDAARRLWRNIELRRSYEALVFDEALRIAPRRDLAASTAGTLIQATGRLLRGGVPFHTYFTDAAWSPATAKEGPTIYETAETSLLQAVIDIVNDYAHEANAVGNALYGALAEALSGTTGLNNN